MWSRYDGFERRHISNHNWQLNKLITPTLKTKCNTIYSYPEERYTCIFSWETAPHAHPTLSIFAIFISSCHTQWNSVITYPQGKWKKVRTNQCTFYPKRGFPHWQDRFHVFTRTICTWKRVGKSSEIETERFVWHARDQKKEPKKGQQKCSSSWRENWYVISDFVPCSVRLIQKKCTCFPIGDVRDRRRERYNRVYVLSRVRTNRVSLYFKLKVA